MPNYKQGTLIDRLRKKAQQELEIAANSRALFEQLKPEYDRWDAAKIVRQDPNDPNSPIIPHEPPINNYVIRTAIDHKLSSERDQAFAEDLLEVIQILEQQEQAEAEATAREAEASQRRAEEFNLRARGLS